MSAHPPDSRPTPSPAPADDRFRLLVERVVDYAILMLDPAGVVVSWNAGAERLKGWRADEILGRHFSTFYSAADVAAGRPGAVLAQAIADGRVEDEGWRTRADGSRFWANVVITALRGPDGELLGFGKVTRDLTSRRAAEERALEAAETFEALLEAAPDGMVLVDAEGRIAFVNRELAAMLGYDRSELEGCQIEILVPDAARDRHPRMRERAHETEGSRPMGAGLELTARHRDGSEVPVEISLSPLSSGDERLTIATLRDVSARRQADALVRESEARLAGVLDAATDYSIIGTDADGRITVFNSGAERMLGYRAEEVLGRHTIDLVHDHEEIHERASDLGLPPDFGVLVSAARQGLSETREWTYVRKDGSTLPVSLTVTAMREGRDEITGFMGIASDISTRLDYERRLRHMAEHDPLTGLPNRLRFEGEVARHVARVRRYGATGAVLMIDLDRFKQINDGLGHHAGDAVLVGVARAVGGRLRATDAAGRIGGDEFCVLMTEGGAAEAERLAADLVELIGDVRIPAAGPPPEVSASIGIALFQTAEAAGVDDLLARADTAMYAAKRRGGHRASFGAGAERVRI